MEPGRPAHRTVGSARRPEPDVLAAGHSHVACLFQALDRVPTRWGLRPAVAYSADPATGAPGDEEYWDMVVREGRGRTVVLVWNGNQHNAAFLIQPDPAFRVDDRRLTDAYDGPGRWLPRRLLEDFFRPTMDECDALLRRLVPVSRVVLLGTPPPKPLAYITAVLPSEPFFHDIARARGLELTELTVSSDQLRLALWHIVQDMLRDSANRGGAEWVPVPSRLIDSQGLLPEEYRVADATHANDAYGAAMWETVADHLTGAAT